MPRRDKKSLGESLVAEGIITEEQLKQAEKEEKKLGLRLRKVLVKMGLVAEEDLVTFLSDKMDLPRIELSNYLIDPNVVESIPEELARRCAKPLIMVNAATGIQSWLKRWI